MTATDAAGHPVTIAGRDGYPLAARVFGGGSGRVVVINGATAVPQRFYRRFAAALAEAGFTAITYDYRGIELDSPRELRRLDATARDWALNDLPGALDWIAHELDPEKLFLVGHSFGGQVAGMVDDPERVAGMVTMSAQSGHWRLQGGEQKLVVWLHTHVSLPLLSKIFGYMPMKAIGAGENMPAGVALEWSRWCRHPDYVLGDPTLPLDRYAGFTAPVLAYSIDDDKWGTAPSVDAMMRAYPNLERRHIVPSQRGLDQVGHLGFFRPASRPLWDEVIEWFDERGCEGVRG
jgi:predicted alpha/beta hydrolase